MIPIASSFVIDQTIRRRRPMMAKGFVGGKVLVIYCGVFVLWCLTLQRTYQRGLKQQQQQQQSVNQALIRPKTTLSSTLIASDNTHTLSDHHHRWDDLWWTTNFKDTALSLDDETGMIVFPVGIRRVWIDVGVHRQSEFLPLLQNYSDLFLLGFEPALTVYRPCLHPRCVVLWAACTYINNNDTTTTTTRRQVQLVDLYLKRFGGMCNSLLPSNTAHPGGCIKAKLDGHGQPQTIRVPGIPLSSLLARIPSHIAVEYLKIDAQGYDLEVMKGAMFPLSHTSSSQQQQQNEQQQPQRCHQLPHIVSLEAMNVQNKSLLLYEHQPTLEEIITFLQHHGWIYVAATNNTASIQEVNAYFAYNISYIDQVNVLLHQQQQVKE